MIFKNKTGAEKIMSVYWFVILVLVAGTIVYMVSVFYGNPYDVREIESNILANNIVSCLSENGILNSQINQDNFLKKCHLNLGNDKDEYYVEVKFYSFGNLKQPLDFKIIKGNINLKKPLSLGIVEGNINLKSFFETSASSNSIFESEKSFYVLNEKKEELIVKIISIIRKTEKNVKQ